jgi:hypothetical protein
VLKPKQVPLIVFPVFNKHNWITISVAMAHTPLVDRWSETYPNITHWYGDIDGLLGELTYWNSFCTSGKEIEFHDIPPF